MAPGDTAPGERIADIEDPHEPHPRLEPGQYRRSGGVWEGRPFGQPESVRGSLRNHEVTEHEDGTITVSPSILIRTSWAGKPIEWHGYLERGVWREV